jgi:ABC-type multidrug transport system fused ATPase/permease subunit
MIATPFSTLVQALPSFVAGISSLSRIEDYASSLAPAANLLTEAELNTNGKRSTSGSDLKQSAKNLGVLQGSGAAVSIQNGRFGWSSDEPVLDKVNLNIPAGSVTAIMGPVGSGKSMLLHGILKQCPMAEGDISVNWSRVAFCPQQPWLVSGTIRRNIVGEQFYDASWYWDVVTACALVLDLESFEDGDMKHVGNEGSNLSGGQRQRVVCFHKWMSFTGFSSAHIS